MIALKPTGFLYKDKQIFNQMLYANMLRGQDATGVFTVDSVGNLDMIKSALPSPNVQSKPEYKALIDLAMKDGMVLVGHNRAATMGKSDEHEFAHPFIEDHICLLHNGTLTSHKHLANVEVDSHAICHAIARDGYKKALPEIYGAFALVWYNAKEKTVYITRNSQRPLHFAVNDDCCYFASEGEMLDWILSRNGIKHTGINVVDTEKVFKFNIETHKLESEAFPKKSSKSHYQVTSYQKQQNLGLTSGGHRSTFDYRWDSLYAVNDEVNFDFCKFVWQHNDCDIIGYVDDFMFSEVKVRVTPEMKDIVNKIQQDPHGNHTLTGTIRMIYKKDDQYTYHLKDIRWTEEDEKVVSFVSDNNVTVTNKMLAEHGGQCNYCMGFISTDKDEDVKDAYVKVKRGQIRKIICGDCLETIRENVPSYRKNNYVQTGNHNSPQHTQSVGKEFEESDPIEGIIANISC